MEARAQQAREEADRIAHEAAAREAAAQAAERRRQQQLEDERAEHDRERKDVTTSLLALEVAEKKWIAGVKLAESTARIALAGPVKSLQDMRATMDEMPVPTCLQSAKVELLSGMDAQLKAFLSFMADRSGHTAYLVLMNGQAQEHFQTYIKEKNSCVESIATR